MEKLNSNGNKRGMSAVSQNNLRPNRNGRLPAVLSLTSLTRRELARIPTIEEDGFDGKGKSKAWWLARNAVRDAMKGDRAARQEVWERIEGKVTIPIGGDSENPVYIITVPSEEGRQNIERVMKGDRT